MTGRSSDGKAVVDALTETIREGILSGALATGTWLRQERLASEHGVSRTPVREALRALQAQGMVEVVPHRGALVCVPTLRDIREGYAVRAELEGYAAELAAEWILDEQLERLREAAELFKRGVAEATETGAGARTDQRPRWSEANDRFHESVLEAAGNARLADTIRTLHRSFPRNLTWSALSGNTFLLQENVAEHREVLRAIAEHRPREARQAMRGHVRRSGELIALRFEQLQSSSP